MQTLGEKLWDRIPDAGPLVSGGSTPVMWDVDTTGGLLPHQEAMERKLSKDMAKDMDNYAGGDTDFSSLSDPTRPVELGQSWGSPQLFAMKRILVESKPGRTYFLTFCVAASAPTETHPFA